MPAHACIQRAQVETRRKMNEVISVVRFHGKVLVRAEPIARICLPPQRTIADGVTGVPARRRRIDPATAARGVHGDRRHRSARPRHQHCAAVARAAFLREPQRRCVDRTHAVPASDAAQATPPCYPPDWACPRILSSTSAAVPALLDGARIAQTWPDLDWVERLRRNCSSRACMDDAAVHIIAQVHIVDQDIKVCAAPPGAASTCAVQPKPLRPLGGCDSRVARLRARVTCSRDIK